MSERVDADLQQLIQSCLAALKSIGVEEAFPPYAMTLVDGAEGELLGTDPGTDPNEALKQLARALATQASGGRLRAFGIVSDATLSNSETGEEMDAIRLHLEHRDTGSVALFLPYEWTDDGRKYGDMRQTPSEPLVFGGAPPSPDPETQRKVALEFIERIPEFAKMHVEKATSLTGVELGYDEACFETTDTLIDEGWGGEKPDNPGILVQLFGSFLGEAIRTLHGGEWTYDDEHGVVHLAGVGAKSVEVFPFEEVMKRFEEGASASIGSYYRDLKQRID